MTYIFKNDSFLSFRCTSEEFHNFFTNIVIPNRYEESHEKYTFNRRFFLPYGRQNDMRFQGRQPFVISSKAGGPTRNLLLPTRNGGDCTLAWREILQGKAFQNDMCFSLRCFTAAQHDNQMLFRVYTRNLLFLFATVMIESFLLYEILHITAFCSE